MVSAKPNKQYYNEKFLARSFQNKDRMLFLGNLNLFAIFLY